MSDTTRDALIFLLPCLALVLMMWFVPSLVRTLIPKEDSQQDTLLAYREALNQETSRPRLEPFSPNTIPTWDTPSPITVILADGVTKEYFYGTRSQVADQVFLYLMTGKSGRGSPARSLLNFHIRELYLRSLEESLDDTSNT